MCPVSKRGRLPLQARDVVRVEETGDEDVALDLDPADTFSEGEGRPGCRVDVVS